MRLSCSDAEPTMKYKGQFNLVIFTSLFLSDENNRRNMLKGLNIQQLYDAELLYMKMENEPA